MQYFIRQLFIFTVLTLLLTACSEKKEPVSPPEPPKSAKDVTLYKNGRIYTVNPNQPWAEAVVTKKDKILFVGSNAEAEQYIQSDSAIVDLQGKMMMPGFHDIHTHPVEAAGVDFVLNSEETDIEKLANDVRIAHQNKPGNGWLIGYNHSVFTLLENVQSFTGSQQDPIDFLNAITTERPIIIMETTSHSMWVNSKALEVAELDGDVADPIGGFIGRNSETGQPNGILVDNAGNLAWDIAMTPTEESLEQSYQVFVNETLPYYAELGITATGDGRSFWQRNDHTIWQRAYDNNKLTLRANVAMWAYPELDDATQLPKLASFYDNDPSSILKFNQIKVYSDGIVTTATAAMKYPYDIDLWGPIDAMPDNKGLNYFTQTRMQKYIEELGAIGFDFHIHAIGDRGIHESLNAIENAQQTNARHRITHIELLDPVDIPRFKQLNVIADMQVAGDFTNPEHWHHLEEFVGHERADNQVPIKSLSDAGATLTLSSDWSVSSLNPFVGLQNAVTRSPQAISLEKAIEAYTINSAYAMRNENVVGTIEAGKQADLIILDRDLFEIAPTEINQTKVLMTVFNGEVVFQR